MDDAGIDRDMYLIYRTKSPQLRLALGRFAEKVRANWDGDIGSITHLDLDFFENFHLSLKKGLNLIVLSNHEEVKKFSSLGVISDELPSKLPSLESEGFCIRKSEVNGVSAIFVLGEGESGAAYGVYDLIRQLQGRNGLGGAKEKIINPEVNFRAIKFNLPWSPYRNGPQTAIHENTCRDLDFWREFLDMMAMNRFNVLSLWNLHPFSFMVKPKNFPAANDFSPKEMKQWQAFWGSLFKMAKERGIETYIINWNIVVSAEFARTYDVDRKNDTSDLVKRYTREVITQVIEEYPHLTGLGVSLCDWMQGMTPSEKQEWFKETFLAGIEEANRSIKFLYRSVLTESIEETRQTIDQMAQKGVAEILVPCKFNWSHGHSTTELELTHDYSSGKVDQNLWDPKPENYRIAWMVRNEDFFILRWGHPNFIREHIRRNYVGKDYVGGYFVGSEAYIPAKDFSHKLNQHQTWQYAFQKQWLFYMLWGQLLYDPQTPNEVFEAAFEDRYGLDEGEMMLEGLTAGSKIPLEIGSFHAGTWDYTLYSEGFLAMVESMGLDEGVSPFISIDELIQHETLASNYLSIEDYVKIEKGEGDGENLPDGAVTPVEVADRVKGEARKAIRIARSLQEKSTQKTARWTRGAFECELLDMLAWGYLGLYFGAKVNAGVKLAEFREGGSRDKKDEAVSLLKEAAEFWDRLAEVTAKHYREVPYATDWEEGQTFSWSNFRDQVRRDIEIAKRSH